MVDSKENDKFDLRVKGLTLHLISHGRNSCVESVLTRYAFISTVDEG